MNFPDYRPRRLRRTESLRRLVRETRLSVDDFVYPLFVMPGNGIERPISSMPGQFNYSVDKAVDAAARAYDLGIPAGTVKSRVYYGLRALRGALEAQGWRDG